jgi:cytochrome P450
LQPIAPQHSFLFGHILFVKGVKETLPPNANVILTMSEICQRYFSEQGICYLDMWPFGDTLVLISSPALTQQATQTNAAVTVERPRAIGDYLLPIAGGPNLLNMPEKEWKPWRAVVNKSFGAAHALALVPSIVDKCLVFRDLLRQLARQSDIFPLNSVARRLTSGFVGHLIL